MHRSIAVLCGLSAILNAACSSDAPSTDTSGAGGTGAKGGGNGVAAAGRANGGGAGLANSAGANAGGAPASAGTSGSAASGAAGQSGGGTSNAGAGGSAMTSCGNQQCDNGELCSTCAADCGACPTNPFGNTTLHPEKIGFYMVPDLDGAYTASGDKPSAATGTWCAWANTQASLYKLHALLPNAWIRWDNETGHNTDTPQNVETFVSCAANAGVPLIITAGNTDGYNNWWANGNATPTTSMTDIANGPYVKFAFDLRAKYSNVKLVETINEADGPWFVSDGDNTGDFDNYLNKVFAITGADHSGIVGPSVAVRGSNLWKDYTARDDLKNVSYHTYGGQDSLTDLAGKQAYVTEYGGFDLNPGAVLADLWHAEKNGKLSGGVRMLFYQQITDNGGNRGAFFHDTLENGHFALRDWFRALTLFQALANVSSSAYFSGDNSDFIATDDRKGNFAALVFNDAAAAMSNQTRTVDGASLNASTPLYALRVAVGDSGIAECKAIADQGAVTAQSANGKVTLQIKALDAHAAVLLSTSPCTALAD